MANELQNIDLAPELIQLLLVGPLMVFISLLLLGRKIRKYRGIYATTITLLLTIVSLYIFGSVWIKQGLSIVQIPWFTLNGKTQIDLNLHVDAISALFICIVMITALMVHLFSIEYLRGDDHFEKYFAYLSLFVFAIIGIILSENLFVIFIFWELVGFSSYLLIGFYYKKDNAVMANKKAFIVNRVGDIGFIIALLTIYNCFGTWNIAALSHLFELASLDNFPQEFFVQYKLSSLNMWLIGGGILSGAVAKSAQFPLNVWLPNAMEGPTPISALIHAATMVAAGVYLLIRTYFLFTPEVLDTIAFIGAVTAFMGAYSAIHQRDIKKVLAYSTISQLGFMFIAIGVRSIESAMFHLMTHAFFKACLFLGAGAIIHSLHGLEKKSEKHFDPQDMKLMGGLRKHMPLVFIAYLIATFALIGLPFTSGFLSKESIVLASINWGLEKGNLFLLVPALALIGVVLTAYYMTRQLLLVFFGETRLFNVLQIEKSLKIPHAPYLMKIPLVILATLSLWGVYSINPLSAKESWFNTINTTFNTIDLAALEKLNTADTSHLMHISVTICTLLLAITGMGIATVKYKYLLKDKVAGVDEFNRAPNFWVKLSLKNWYLDDLYHFVFITPQLLTSYFTVFLDKVIISGSLAILIEINLYLARLVKRFDSQVLSKIVDLIGYLNVIFAQIIYFMDRYLIDGTVHLVVNFTRTMGSLTKGLQIGNVQQYVITAIAGAVLLITLTLYMV